MFKLGRNVYLLKKKNSNGWNSSFLLLLKKTNQIQTFNILRSCHSLYNSYSLFSFFFFLSFSLFFIFDE